MPGTENLPKVEANLKEEIEKPSELKHVEVIELIDIGRSLWVYNICNGLLSGHIIKPLSFTFQVAEKIVLPSAEDLKNEKVHENLQKGIEGFTPDKLKAVKTKEPASGADRKKTVSCI